MSALEKIVDRGNRNDDNWITCADGFRLSVLAKAGAYCTPRVAFSEMYLPNLHEVPSTYPGPYTHVEAGYPSERPEPWACHHERNEYRYSFDDESPDEVSSYCKEHPTAPNEGTGWRCYVDGGTDNFETVYGYVPVAMVAALIASHGGEA